MNFNLFVTVYYMYKKKIIFRMQNKLASFFIEIHSAYEKPIFNQHYILSAYEFFSKVKGLTNSATEV